MTGLLFSVPFFGIAFAVLGLLLCARPSVGSSWGKPAANPGTWGAHVLGLVPRLSPVNADTPQSPVDAGTRGQATFAAAEVTPASMTAAAPGPDFFPSGSGADT